MASAERQRRSRGPSVVPRRRAEPTARADQSIWRHTIHAALAVATVLCLLYFPLHLDRPAALPGHDGHTLSTSVR